VLASKEIRVPDGTVRLNDVSMSRWPVINRNDPQNLLFKGSMHRRGIEIEDSISRRFSVNPLGANLHFMSDGRIGFDREKPLRFTRLSFQMTMRFGRFVPSLAEREVVDTGRNGERKGDEA
jgi:hypothetical protein